MLDSSTSDGNALHEFMQNVPAPKRRGSRKTVLGDLVAAKEDLDTYMEVQASLERDR